MHWQNCDVVKHVASVFVYVMMFCRLWIRVEGVGVSFGYEAIFGKRQ